MHKEPMMGEKAAADEGRNQTPVRWDLAFGPSDLVETKREAHVEHLLAM